MSEQKLYEVRYNKKDGNHTTTQLHYVVAANRDEAIGKAAQSSSFKGIMSWESFTGNHVEVTEADLTAQLIVEDQKKFTLDVIIQKTSPDNPGRSE